MSSRVTGTLLLLAALAATSIAGCGRLRRGPDTAPTGGRTARRVAVQLRLEQASVVATGEELPFTLRVTNAERDSARVVFTGEPLTDRGPREKVPVPALWYVFERTDIGSQPAAVHHAFAVRDTVLAPGESMEIPWRHSLREVGLRAGAYRMRAGIGEHVSDWAEFRVTP